ncbi:15713_t:CDS:2, partial [Acaulospora colombiana]
MCCQPYNDNKNSISQSNSDIPLPAKSEKITSESTKIDNRQSLFSSSGNSIEKHDIAKNISSLNGIAKHTISHNSPTTNGMADVYPTSISEESIKDKNQYATKNSFPPLGNSITSNGHTGKTQSNINRPTNGQMMNQNNVSTNDETQIPLPDSQNLKPTLANTNNSGENGNHYVPSSDSVPKDVNAAVCGTQSQSQPKGTNSISTSNKQPVRWADLLRDNGEATTTTTTITQKPVAKPLNSSKQEKPTAPLPNGKPIVGGLAGVTLPPRGLVNNGNMCFMNAVFGEHILPDYVYDALRGLKRFDSMKGRQEDAEEFLGFLLDGLHEEFLRVSKPSVATNGQTNFHEKVTSPKDDPEDIWMETDIEESPISCIFGGQFRSVLQCSGSSDSITRQPYQSLQLDIQPDDVKTIEDALKNLTAPENVEFKSKKGLARATKRLYIEKLPPILTLHLKRFLYDNVGGTQKLSKHVGYSTTLSIPPELMAPGRRPSNATEYQLFGVVYHHGKSATGGHYTADILRNDNEWLHIDDTTISPISADEVAVMVENSSQTTDR